MPEYIQYHIALESAKKQSAQNHEPIAIYKESGEYKIKNAFEAYASGFGPVICEVVSAYNGNAVE